MRAVIQLVKKASVSVDNTTVSKIGYGLVVLLGVHKNDTAKDVQLMAEKIAHLRIFPDQGKLMNLSVQDVGGEILVVSQFTLFGDCRKGRRPSYSEAAPPDLAEELYEMFIEEIDKFNITVASGRLQAMMDVALVNQGPVTLLLDSVNLHKPSKHK